MPPGSLVHIGRQCRIVTLGWLLVVCGTMVVGAQPGCSLHRITEYTMSDALASMYRRAESMQVDSTSWVGISNLAMGRSPTLCAVQL